MLAVYFPDSRNYWKGRPFRDDPDGSFHQVHNWTAWAWEVRFSEPESLRKVDAWCPRPEAWNEIHDMVKGTGFPVAGAVPNVLVDLLNKSELLDSRGSPEYAKKIEQWAQKRCGL